MAKLNKRLAIPYLFGDKCTYHVRADKLKGDKCPFCKGLMRFVDNEIVWNESVKSHDKDNPGWKKFISWVKDQGTCWNNWGEASMIYESATGLSSGYVDVDAIRDSIKQ